MTRSKAGSRIEIRPGVHRVFASAGTDETGKRVRPSVTVRGTDTDAATVQAMMVADTARKNPYELRRASKRVGEYAAEWIETKDVTKRTRIGYEQVIRLYIEPTYKNVMLDAITPHSIKLWISRLKKTPKQRQPKDSETVVMLSRSTVYAAWEHLHMLLEEAIVDGYLDENPMRRVSAPPRPPAHRKNDTLTASDYDAYLNAFEGSEIERFVLTMLGAGTRVNEAAARVGADYEFWTEPVLDEAGEKVADLNVCAVSIEDGLKQWGGKVWRDGTKTEASRARVLIVGRIAARLKKLRGFGPIVPEKVKLTDQPVKPAKVQPMKPDKIARIYRKTIADAGLRYVPMKNLRHTFAMFMLDAEVPVRVLQEMMRHTSVRTTEGYVSQNLDRQIQAAPKIAKRWGA